MLRARPSLSPSGQGSLSAAAQRALKFKENVGLRRRFESSRRSARAAARRRGRRGRRGKRSALDYVALMKINRAFVRLIALEIIPNVRVALSTLRVVTSARACHSSRVAV